MSVKIELTLLDRVLEKAEAKAEDENETELVTAVDPAATPVMETSLSDTSALAAIWDANIASKSK